MGLDMYLTRRVFGTKPAGELFDYFCPCAEKVIRDNCSLKIKGTPVKTFGEKDSIDSIETYKGASKNPNLTGSVTFLMKVWGSEELTPVEFDGEKIYEINEKVAYWRKFNALHNWFVNNVQKGKDDCKSYLVAKDDFERLLEVCTTIMDSKDKRKVAEELMPTASGFFFGNTLYDEYYFDNIEELASKIRMILKNFLGSYYYTSSW